MLNKIIGVDLGATKIAAGLVTKDGRVSNQMKIKTQASQGPKKIIDNLVNLIRQYKSFKVGLAVAGQIDIKKGKIIFAPNMSCLNNFSLVSTLQEKLGKRFKIKIDNDANCFALAENKFGAGKGVKNIVCLTLGTGIGGGVIIDNRLYHGQGFGSELGHMIIESNGRLCPCGKRGHLEAYASGGAIERRYKKIADKKLSATEIEKKAKQGDKIAKQIYKEASQYLARGLASLVNILDPEIIIIGGGVGVRSQLIYKYFKPEIEKNIFFKDRRVKIQKSKLGEKAGIIGAAMLFY